MCSSSIKYILWSVLLCDIYHHQNIQVHLNCMHFIVAAYMISGCNDCRVNLWKSTKNSYSKKSDKILDFVNNDREMKMIMGKVIYIGMEEHCRNLSQDMIPLQITSNKLQIWNILHGSLPGNDTVQTGRWVPTYWTIILKSKVVCSSYTLVHTGCPRRNVRDFGRVFLMLNYTDITQNTYIQSWTVTEIMAREVWNFDSCYTLTDCQIHIETGRNMWFP